MSDVSRTAFPVTNVPFGMISTVEESSLRPATIIGDIIIDLSALESAAVFKDIASYPSSERPLSQQSLNSFASLPRIIRSAVRTRVQDLWVNGELGPNGRYAAACLEKRKVVNHLPMETRNYTDYVSSRGHFENIQNINNTPQQRRNTFYHNPMGYYGNSRGIVISGTPVQRFCGLIDGQFQCDGVATFGPSAQFDFELELGVYISQPSEPGRPVNISQVDDHIFGFVLLNDWSARDIQKAESGGPTGPFLAKSGSVTISPWIITLDALKCSRLPRTHPHAIQTVAHLDDPNDATSNLDIRCSVEWLTQHGRNGMVVSKGEYRETYWTYRQLLAHQTCNGASVGTGDLMGTGTMSMYKSDDLGRACLIERTYGGKKEIDMGNGESRIWILDGDEINLNGWIHDSKTGKVVFGFGDCRGVVVPMEV